MVVSGQRISSRVAGASTVPVGSSAAGSARNAAQRAMSVAVLQSWAAGPTAPKSVGGSGCASSEYASTRKPVAAVGRGVTVVSVSPSGVRIRSVSTCAQLSPRSRATS